MTETYIIKSILDRCDALINDYEALLVNEQVSLVFQEDVWELKKEIKNIIREPVFVEMHPPQPE